MAVIISLDMARSWGLSAADKCGRRVIYKVFIGGSFGGEICDKDEKSNWLGHRVDRGVRHMCEVTVEYQASKEEWSLSLQGLWG